MKISVCIITYNHFDYIERAISSVIDQKHNFEMEILIGDDGSTDGTSKVCEKYAKMYPDLITHFIRDRSSGIHINGRRTGRKNFLDLLQSAKGEYIALLEGDDYWYDTTKLNLQVKALDKFPSASFSFHPVQILKGGEISQDYLNEFTPRIVEPSLIAKGNIIRTCSVVFRNNFQREINKILYSAPVGDYALHLINASFGHGIFINRNMAVYRMHEGGIWSNYKSISRNLEWNGMLSEFSTVFEEPMRSNLLYQQEEILNSLISYYKKENELSRVQEFELQLASVKASCILKNIYSKKKRSSNFSRKSIFHRFISFISNRK